MSVKSIREDLHKIPEFGKQEFKTKEYILDIARTLSCEIYEPTPTGLVLFFNNKSKKTICFRADMDALPITEENDIPYKSQHKGYMHACGHDGHMAMLIEFAIWASEHKELLSSNVACLFQPSEENEAGSLDILDSGILDKLKVEEIYGFHVWPDLEFGKIYSMPKGLLASSGEVVLHFVGKSVHAANRNLGCDAILAASEFILEAYSFEKTIPEKHLFSIGTIHGGRARNVVADDVILEATMRAFDDETMNQLKNGLENIKKKVEEKYGVSIEISINLAYKSVINSKTLFDSHKEMLSIEELKAPYLQAEDFGNYTRKYPALFMLLGLGDSPLLHTSCFDFDSKVLQTGVLAYIQLATK